MVFPKNILFLRKWVQNDVSSCPGYVRWILFFNLHNERNQEVHENFIYTFPNRFTFGGKHTILYPKMVRRQSLNLSFTQ